MKRRFEAEEEPYHTFFLLTSGVCSIPFPFITPTDQSQERAKAMYDVAGKKCNCYLAGQ